MNEGPQISQFTTGGYVIHKITIAGYKGRFSAWYDKDGKMLNAEQLFNHRFGGRNVKRGGPAWHLLEKIGLRNKP